MKTVMWFSAGVSSAVALWLARDTVDEIIYCHIEDQHEDTVRFLNDVEALVGRPVKVLVSPYKSVSAVIRQFRYVNGPHGARCTDVLKKRVRKEWERTQTEPLRYIWGMDVDEKHRADRLIGSQPDQEHVFPLIEKGMSKEQVHGLAAKLGLKRPAMYDMGYPNNNCIGCVKGGAGYWNKIRLDFPHVFKTRAEDERLVGASCLKGVFLDELDPNAGRACKIIMPECGIMCELKE